MLKKPLLHLLLFLLMNCASFGQQAKQYVFSRFSTVTGLASNFVNNLVQDKKGFIWVATINGLQRYDGHKFVTYKHQTNNPLTPPTDNIARVYSDRHDNLWITTNDNKVGIFNTETYTYNETPVAPKIASSIFINKRIFESQNGRLWMFVSGEGVYLYDTTAKSFRLANEQMPAPKNWKYVDIHEDTVVKKFWIACDSGLALYDPASRHLSYRGHNIDNDPVIQKFENEKFLVGIHTDNPDHFITVTWGPLDDRPNVLFYDRSSRQITHYDFFKEVYKGYHEVIGSLRQSNGRQWFYGKPFITEYKGGAAAFESVKNEYRDEQSIKFETVNFMYEDHEKNLWVCSDNGLFLFNPDDQIFYSYNLERPGDKEAIEGPTQSVLQLKNSQVWVGTWSKGVYCYDKDLNPLAVPASLQKVTKSQWSIWCMVEKKDTSLIWMGLQGGCIIVYNQHDQTTKVFWPDVFKGRTVRQVTEDKEGNLWFGSHGGHIVKWDKKEANGDPEKGFQLITKAVRIVKIFTDKSGSIWAASFGAGLYKINPLNNKVINFSKDGPEGQRLYDDGPTDILQYDDTTLLIANGTVDVVNTRTNRITNIGSDQGLPSNDVQCLQRDNNGMIWLGMLSGLTRMNLERKIFIGFDRRDGIRYDIFNAGGAFRLANSNLVFTTDHNFLVFDPDKLVQKDPPPDVKILDFNVANNPLIVDSLLRLKRIQLEYNKNSITISFGTLSFLTNNKNLYYYQLEKIDADWIKSDDRHQAIYNYLPPGTYTFKVKCINGYGLSSVNTTSLVISVNAPFWKTWWFYAIILLLAMAVLYWIDKERIRRLFTLQQLRTQIADNLHKDVNTTLNNIHLLSEIAKIKADKDIIKSKEYIDQINTKSRRMISDMDDMLWSINPANDSMQKTLERMNEFAEGIKNINNCRIDMIVDEKVKALKLDMRMRHEIFYIFKESLSSIVRHSNCADSIINIDLVKSHLLIQIHDNGFGFDTKTLQNSNEMKEMEKRARLLNALLDIQSDKKGTTVILQVPV